MALKRPLRGRAVPLAAMLVVLAAAVFARIGLPDLAQRSLEVSFDALTRAAPRPPSEAPVHIVDIDDASLAKIGQWPWPRLRLAELVETLREAGAVAIAFDMVFADPDRTSPAVAASAWALPEGARRIVEALPDHDAVFAQAISGGGVITGFVLVNEASRQRPPVAKAGVAWAGPSPQEVRVPAFAGALATLPEIEAAASGNGSLHFITGEDGVVRRVPVFVRFKDALLPALSMETLRVADGAGSYLAAAAPDGSGSLERVRVGLQMLETDANGALWLRFASFRPDRAIPAWEILGRSPRLAEVKDAIVIVGSSDELLRDLRFTPLGVVPGVEIHRQIIEQILEGRGLVRLAWAQEVEIFWIVVAGLLVTAAVLLGGPLVGAILSLLAILGGVGVAWIAFAHDFLFDPLFPTVALVGLFLAGSVPLRIASERERNWVRNAFSSYLSPNLVEHLIEHPEELRLGGERRECSFVMTDIAGFTAFIEKSQPEEVVKLLDEYLDGMVRAAFAHGGTLDRVVGDAVAVMFSAPVPQSDHAARAVACALEMDGFASVFRRERRAAGVALGRTRIGVNTGPVLVGNVGGTTLDYRALGDAVNTAARLETVNRYLGTRICVSGDTVSRCPDFRGRPIGRLLLAGKSVAVEAFEPLTPARDVDAAAAAYREAFRLLETRDPGALERFAELAEAFPDDPLIAFHHGRLASGEHGVLVSFAQK
jgi:adenylate cyclase